MGEREADPPADSRPPTFAEGRISEQVPDFLLGGCLQDITWMMRQVPQNRIQITPYFVGGMIPRPVQIQSKLRQQIKPIDFRGKEIVDRVTDTGLLIHDSFFESVSESFLERPRQNSQPTAMPPWLYPVLLDEASASRDRSTKVFIKLSKGLLNFSTPSSSSC